MNEFDTKFARGQFTRVGMGLFGFIAGSFAVQITMTILATLLFPEVLYEDWFLILMGALATYGAGMPIAIGIIRSGAKSVFQPSCKMGFKDFMLAFCAMYGITIVGNQIGTTLMGFAEGITGKEISNPVVSDYEGWSFWMNIFMLMVLAPVLEELLFRKCIIDAILPYGECTAIIVSAVTFGLAHGNFFQFFYSAGVGLLFAYIYIKTGKIRNTMILHAALNFVGGTIPLLMMEWSEQLTDITGFSDIGAMLSALNDMGFKAVAVLVFSYIMSGIGIAGIIILIFKKKQFKLNKPAMPIPAGQWFITVFVNVGIILFVVLSSLLFIGNILA